MYTFPHQIKNKKNCDEMFVNKSLIFQRNHHQRKKFETVKIFSIKIKNVFNGKQKISNLTKTFLFFSIFII
jgi:hypothetical protein